ncbi:MAG: RimK family alpha-L-glutamate ligase [Candidatus Ranarchaeia archaeon]
MFQHSKAKRKNLSDNPLILILSEDPQTWHNKQLVEAAMNHHISPMFASITKMTGRIGFVSHAKIGRYDDLDRFNGVILVRFIPRGSLEQIIFRLDLLRRIERLGIPVVNPARAIERATDKYYTSTLLEEAGIPTPKTIVCESPKDAMKAFHRLGGDVIIKPLFGSQGLGISRISDSNVAYQVFSNLELIGAVYYLQEYVEHGTTDARVFIANQKVVAAMQRKGKDWKTNVARGGEPIKLLVTHEISVLAKKATAVLGCCYAGVDILETENGLLVIEVNAIPAWKGLQSVTSVNIAQAIIGTAIDIYKKRELR